MALTFPILETPRTELIEITQAHIPEMFRLLTDKKVTEYFPVIPLEQESDTEKVISMLAGRYQQNEGIRWGIRLKQSGELVGTIGFNSFVQNEKATVVFMLHPAHWRKGLITEALSEVLQYAFAVLNAATIEAEVIPGNTASEKLLEKNSFSFTKLIQNGMQWGDKTYDIKLYTLKHAPNE
jgi:ribosomal-protein-alanine N-acetyltransferase